MSRAILTAARLSSLIQKIYPRQLAGSWDNTGLLLESPYTRDAATDNGNTKVLLCIDLTTDVCNEALSIDGCAHVVAYHPIIFTGLKSLTLANTQQRSLLRLAAAGVSVYSPHTAVDAVRGGVNDMLASTFSSFGIARTDVVEATKSSLPGFGDAGIGRIVSLDKATMLQDLVDAIKKKLNLNHVQLARSPRAKRDHEMVLTIGLCAGSGGSVLKNLNVDLIFTGELSHHEQLAFTQSGTHVILCGHSDTERPYLPTMQQKIQNLCKEAEQDQVEVLISKADASPFETV